METEFANLTRANCPPHDACLSAHVLTHTRDMRLHGTMGVKVVGTDLPDPPLAITLEALASVAGCSATELRNARLNQITSTADNRNRFTISQSPGREPWTLADALTLLDDIEPSDTDFRTVQKIEKARAILRDHLAKYPNGRCSCGKPLSRGTCRICDNDD